MLTKKKQIAFKIKLGNIHFVLLLIKDFENIKMLAILYPHLINLIKCNNVSLKQPTWAGRWLVLSVLGFIFYEKNIYFNLIN